VAALEKLNIDTPEQIGLEFSLASIGSRFLAVAIDSLIQFALALLLFGVVIFGAWIASMTVEAANTWLAAALILGLFLVYYGYFAAYEVAWNGQTPGKRFIGLRVIHATGRPLSPFEAVLRNIVRVVDQFPGIYAIGIIAVFLSERSQRLGDLAAGTVVVHERAAMSGFDEIMRGADPLPSAARHGATKLSQPEISVIELFLRRRGELDGHARVRTATSIADRIRGRLEITSEIDNERLLEEVVAEYKSGRQFR
jgi:uncharacterized RDD family membrane protein YckC